MKTLEDIYASFPELEEIAMRLEDSEKEATAKNKERKNTKMENQPDFQFSSDKKKRTLCVNAEVSRISDFYKDKRWTATSYISKPGRKEFEFQLMRVIETRNPDALKIKVFPSNRELTCRLDKTVWLNKDEFSDTADKQETNTTRSLGAVETAIEQLKKDFAENNQKGTNTIDMNTQMQIINLQHAQNLKDIKHAQEIESLKRDYEDKIRQYQQELDNRDDEIEDLEQELADVEDSLNGIEDKIEAAKNPSYMDIAAKVVSRGIENLAKDNKKLIGNFLGMTESDLDNYFKDKDDNKQISTQTNSSAASYSTEEQTDSFSHLDEEKRKFAESLTAMVTAMDIESLRIIVTIIQMITDEDFALNNIAEELLKKAYELKKVNN